MTGSRKTNKPHHPNQQIPTCRRASRIAAARDEARRKFDEMQQNKTIAGSSTGMLKRSPSSYNLANKTKDDAVKAELPGSMEMDEEFDDGFMIVSMPGGVEARVVETRKAKEERPAEEKAASD